MNSDDNIIARSGTAPFFAVANAAEIGLEAPENRKGDAVRTWGRSLAGFQKEALIVSARTGLTWRLASDEGAYLNGHDAAPCPLAFLTCGMIASYANEITALARAQGVELRGLELAQDNYYTMQGSMRERTMTGGALAPELTVTVACDLPDAALHELLSDAVHASPLNGLLRGRLASLFALSRNGRDIAPDGVLRVEGPLLPDPGDAFERARALPGEATLVERLGPSPKKAVPKGTAGAASSLTDRQDRTLNPGARCTLRADGIKEIEQYLYSPHGSVFRFLSDEALENGGGGHAPDANTLISAGIGFCFMTQLGRFAAMEGVDLRHYAIVQDTHFSLGGASGGTGRPGAADPVETHVHLRTGAGDDVAREMLDISERTCFLHALCRTDLKPKLKVQRR